MNLEHKKLKSARIRTAIDYPAMMASMLAIQSRSQSRIAQIDHDVARGIADCPGRAMVTLLEGKSGWRAAAQVLGGSFHPGVATLMDANNS